jgi:hypothetical protein
MNVDLKGVYFNAFSKAFKSLQDHQQKKISTRPSLDVTRFNFFQASDVFELYNSENVMLPHKNIDLSQITNSLAEDF